MEEKDRFKEKISFDLTSFKKANQDMIATNDRAYGGDFLDRRRVERLKDYSREDVERIINSGSLTEQTKLSRNYYYKDGFYRRIITHYATLLKYSGILIPNPTYGKKLSTSHIEKRYYNAMDYTERMDLPNLLTRFSIRAFVDGGYYGVIQKRDKSTFSVLDLPYGYCCSRFKDANGNDIVEFDVSYFDSLYDAKAKEMALSTYPKVITSAYKAYRRGKRTSRWVFIPSDIGICFQIFDGRPFFLNVIPAAIDYDEAVETEKERDLEEIKKIIVQKIPHTNEGELLFEPTEAEEMHTGTVGMMKGNKNVSILTTYADVDAIQSKTSADTVSNNLEKMMNNIFYEANTSPQIFAATGNLALDTSLKNDLALVMILGNKYSTFITNSINKLYANSNITFKYKILPITYQNDDKFMENSYKLATTGYSFLLPAIASGLDQKDLRNVKELENDVLKLSEKLIPLNSAFTQSGSNDGAGAPAKPLEQKSAKTIQNEESLDRQGQQKDTQSNQGGSSE